MSKSQAKPITKNQFNTTFVDCNLDKSTKETVKQWDTKFEVTLDAIDRMVFDGYKISMSIDRQHDCVAVYATMNDASHKNHALCLSARAPNYLNALKVLVYKHFTILQEDWSAVVDQDFKGSQWA